MPSATATVRANVTRKSVTWLLSGAGVLGAQVEFLHRLNHSRGRGSSKVPSAPTFDPNDFLTDPHSLNQLIPSNIQLVCGDPLLELQSNAINTLSNTQIPGTDTWIAVLDWIRDFLAPLKNQYDRTFIDCNPSFSIYTQIALASVDRLVLSVMADDSSKRAVQNALSLVYGLKLPSEIYTTYAFNTKLEKANRSLPKVHLIAKNRITQYMGPASAYAAVLSAIEADIAMLLKKHPTHFTFKNISVGTCEIRDVQTTGVVAFAKGVPSQSFPLANKISAAIEFR